MKTFNGQHIRAVKDRELVVVQSIVPRQIHVKLPIVDGGRRSFVLLPDQHVLTTGKGMRDAGLLKERDRSGVVVSVLPEAVADMAERRLGRHGVVALGADDARALLDITAVKIAEDDAKKKAEEEAAAAAAAEENARRQAELAKQAADHEKFLEDERRQSKANSTLEDAIKLQETDTPPVTQEDMVVDDAPPEPGEPAAATEVAAADDSASPVVAEDAGVRDDSPADQTKEQSTLAGDTQPKKTKRPKKRD